MMTFLLGCAKELRPKEPWGKKIERADWEALRRLFRDLRGIGLEAFPSFESLDALQLLANACRHGDGPSAVELSRRCPDLWRPISPMPFGDLPPAAKLQTVGTMQSVLEERVNYIVRIHEWAHANFHLGVTLDTSAELATASLRDDEEFLRIAFEALTAKYESVESYVHEQIAQALTWLAQEDLRAQAPEPTRRRNRAPGCARHLQR